MQVAQDNCGLAQFFKVVVPISQNKRLHDAGDKYSFSISYIKVVWIILQVYLIRCKGASILLEVVATRMTFSVKTPLLKVYNPLIFLVILCKNLF